MKALTLYAPWGYAIAHLNKRLENRGWIPPKSVLGQRIAIHTGKVVDRDAVAALQNQLGTMLPELPTSCIECTAVVKGWIAKLAEDHPQRIWYAGGKAWVLDDVITLPHPIPCRGAQGLWAVPPEIEAQIVEVVDHE